MSFPDVFKGVASEATKIVQKVAPPTYDPAKVEKQREVKVRIKLSDGRFARAKIFGNPDSPTFGDKVDAAKRDIEDHLGLNKPTPAKQPIRGGSEAILGGTVFDPSRKPQTPQQPQRKPTPKEEAEQATRNVLRTKSGPEFRQAVKKQGDALNRAALSDVRPTREGDPSLVGDEGIGSVAKKLGGKDAFKQLQQVVGTAARTVGGAVSPALNLDNAKDQKILDTATAELLGVPGSPEEVVLNLGLAALGPLALRVAGAALRARPRGSMRDIAEMIFSQEGRQSIKQADPSIASVVDSAPNLVRAKFAPAEELGYAPGQTPDLLGMARSRQPQSSPVETLARIANDEPVKVAPAPAKEFTSARGMRPSDMPTMEQYSKAKSDQPNALVARRYGDFYEFYGDDAKFVAKELGLTLTSQNIGGKKVPMAGIPAFNPDRYLESLQKSGKRVQILDIPSSQVAKEIDNAPILARAKFNQIPGVSDELKTFTPEARPARAIGGPEVPAQVPTQPKSLRDVFTEAANVPKSTPIPGASADVVGLAKQITKRDPLPGTNPARVFEAGKEAVETGRINPSEVVSRVKTKGVTNLAEDEIGATVYRLRQIRNRQAEIEAADKTGDPLETVTKNKEWADLDAEAEDILTAGDIIGNQWHRTGMALQVAIKRDMSLGGLVRRARAFADEPLKPGVEAQLQEISRKYEDAMRQLDATKKQYFDDLLRVPRPEEPPRFMAKSREQARSTASAYFKNQKMNPTGGVGRNRQRGAVSYTVSDDEMRAKSAVRKLAREIVTDGAQTLDEVLDGIRREIGVDVKDDDLLAFLHEPYSKYRLEADTARIKANQVFRELQRGAEFRAKTKVQQVGAFVIGATNGIGRSFTLGADFSAPFIQGVKTALLNPVGWIKAFAPMFRSVGKGGQDFALQTIAKIEADPFYARAKAAGLDLTLPGTGFTQQEEIYAGNIRQLTEALSKLKPAGRAVTLPFEAWGRTLVASEDAYTTFLNAVRYDTFKKMAKAAPDDPEYLRDVAQLINVISGRGTGRFAQSVSNPVFGNLLTAPRYTVSQIQYSTMVPLWTAKTAKGRAQAVRIYATHAAAAAALMGYAKMNGWEVDNDLRSSTFGQISKGDFKINVIGREVQFIRMLFQSAYGKISKSQYTEPSAQNYAENIGQYLTGKAAPLPRLASEKLFGVYDDGETRQLEGKDLPLKVLPLWVADMWKDRDKYKGREAQQALATIMNIFGIDVKPQPVNSVQRDLDLREIGRQF